MLLVAIGFGISLYRSSDDHPTAGLTVVWGGSEGHPCCVYDPRDHTVDAKVTIEGEVSRPDKVTVTVTVTAYADENTSIPVGSASRSVKVTGRVHTPLLVTIPVEKAPHVGEDGIVAAALSVKY